MTKINPGRFTRAAVHTNAGEAHLSLSDGGNWKLHIRRGEEENWRLACSGDLESGAEAALPLDNEPLQLGPVVVDLAARQTYVGEKPVALSTHEFDLLACLALDPNRVMSKSELMAKVWGYEASPSCRTLDSHASRVRVKLRRAGAEGLIDNCWGVGYRFWNGGLGAPKAA